MVTAKPQRLPKPRTTFPVADTYPKPWLELREDFRRDFDRAPAAGMFHALQIRSGIPSDEPPDEWKTLLEHHVGKFAKLNWHNALPRLGALQAVQHCTFGQFDEVSQRLIAAADELVKSQPLFSGLHTDSFSLVLYLIALARPHSVSYCIRQASFGPNDWPLGAQSFGTLDDFERWESGERELQKGRYFLMLSCDIRLCAISAIDTMFNSGVGQRDEVPTARRSRLEVDISRNVAVVEGVEFHVQPHEAQMLNSLVEARNSGEWWVSGPEMQNLPGCRGKKVSREFKKLEGRSKAFEALIEHGGNKGYRLKE